MPRSAGSGLNVARRKRTDGSTVEYYYDAKTKKFLGHSREQALRAKGGTAPPDTIAGLIAFYRSSNAYGKLAAGTKVLYDNYLDQLQDMFGSMHPRTLRYSTVELLKKELQSQPSRCNMVLALLRIILGVAVRLEMVPVNVASKPGRIEAPPRKVVWSVEAEEHFLGDPGDEELGEARSSLRLGFMLLLYTMQRPSDVLDMKVSHISEKNGRLFIALKQAKTDELLDVPVHTRLEPCLRERLGEALPTAWLVASPKGFRWTRRNFSRAWDKRMKAADLDSFQRRDLRRTGIVRAAEAGMTVAQIASVSGHSIDYCQRIIDTYLPRRTEVAVAGMEVWEKAGKYHESTVVQLASRRRK